MNRNRVVGLVVAVALAVAGCGGGNGAASGDAAPEPTRTPTPTATATATARPKAEAKPTPAPGKCDEVKSTPPEPSKWTHPGSNFYAPDDDFLPTKEDLDYLVLHDNVVVITYAA